MSDDMSANALPHKWEVCELGVIVADIQTGFASGKHNSLGQGVVHIRPMNVSRTGILDFAEVKFVEDTSARRLVRGDVLFNNTNSPALVGKTAYVDTDKELAFSNHMTRLRPDVSRLDAKFLATQLHAMWMNGYFEAICSNHVNQASVSSKRLQSVAVNVPPLAEQEKIVEILEEQLSRLDAALDAVRAVRVKAAQFRRSLLHAAFTGALTGHDTSAGTLPAGWEDVSAGEIARLNYGYTESASADPVGPKFLRITDIQDGRVSWDDVPYCLISPENEQKHRLISGDIVFARTGATTGKSFLIMDPPNAVCASYLIRLQPNVEMVRPQYLQYFFQSDGYWQQVRAETTGTAQGGVNASKLSKLAVVLPPLGEQDKIVEILEEQLSRLDASLAVANTVEKRAAALRRSLLHAAFTGNLTKQWRENAHV